MTVTYLHYYINIHITRISVQVKRDYEYINKNCFIKFLLCSKSKYLAILIFNQLLCVKYIV